MKADPMKVHNLAKKYASFYLGKGIDYEDLVAIAMLGAVIACKRFDPSKGVFTTIAVIHMRDELNRACYRKEVTNWKTRRNLRFIEKCYDPEILEIMIDKSFDEEINLIEGDCFKKEVMDKILRLSEKLPGVQKSAFIEYLTTESYTNHIEKYGKGNFKTNRSSAASSDSTAKLKIVQWMKEDLAVTA